MFQVHSFLLSVVLHSLIIDIVEQIRALHPTISTIHTFSSLPGLSVEVLHHGKILYTAHFSHQNVNLPTPHSDDTIYYIASFVKLLTALTVALLVNNDTRDWDVPGIKCWVIYNQVKI